MDSKRHQLMPRIQLNADHGECVVRATASFRLELDRLLFRRYPNAEWGTFFRFGYRKTRWGMLACFVDLLPPGPASFDGSSPLVEFTPGYISSALKSFDSSSLGVGFIHSHPENCPPTPSWADDDMDRYFASEFEKFSGGRPYVSLIASRGGDGRRSFTGRCFDRGTWIPVGQWLTCGKDVLLREVNMTSVAPTDADGPAQERLRQLLGSDASGRLKGSRIGIVGCSGLGSPAAHVLARAGIGSFVLVDSGFYKPSNHERNHASFARHLGQAGLKKVDLVRRHILRINPHAEVTTLAKDVLDEQAVDELVRCDVILGCTDSFYARAALGDLAIHYNLPVLDMAVQMNAPFGVLTEQLAEIARYLPGLPCPWCRNRVTAADIRAETATEEDRAQAAIAVAAARQRGEDGAQYWIGQRRQDLTVGYMTTAVGAMGAGYAQTWLTGTAKIPHDRFQFDLGLAGLAVVADQRDPIPGCTCTHTSGYADQAAADRTVSALRGLQ